MASQTMRALVLDEFGGPLHLRRVPRPTPAPGQVLVRVRAAGVNPLDLKIRAGRSAHIGLRLPAVLGVDLAGTIEEVGPGVIGYLPGDHVYGLTGGVGDLPGSLAEYVAVDVRLIAHQPLTVTQREAAALPLATITAWEGLVDRARLRAGQRVLVCNGERGVGHTAVQIALAYGADVYATAAPGHLAAVAALGATPVDASALDVAAYVAKYTDSEGFDIVYDTAGGGALDEAFSAVRTYTGHVVSSRGWETHALAPLCLRAATYSAVFPLLPMLTGRDREHHGDILRVAASLADAGVLRPCLDPRRFCLDDAEEAYGLIRAGADLGKLVVDI